MSGALGDDAQRGLQLLDLAVAPGDRLEQLRAADQARL
jgi:hypothetical protein